jgi:hypothetical protein
VLVYFHKEGGGTKRLARCSYLRCCYVPLIIQVITKAAKENI